GGKPPYDRHQDGCRLNRRPLPGGPREKVDEIPNPATGEAVASLPYSSKDQLNQAVAAAKKAFPGWSETPVPDRAQVMFRFKALFDEHIEELSALVTTENGKTLEESRGEVKRAIEVIDFACGAPTLMMGHNLDQIAKGIDEELVRSEERRVGKG